MVLTALQALVGAGFAASVAYLSFALHRVVSYRRRPVPAPADLPAVTVAKPVCGTEAELEENLRSWFRQEYPRFEIVFGVRDPDDPALPILRRVMADFPAVASTLLVHGGEISGTNRKAANLVSICRRARHPIVVVSDADTRAGPDLLAAIASEYADESVGAVSCLTVATPVGGLPSRLGAMYVNEEFLPSVLVSLALRKLDFCLGPTMSARRRSLDAIGGFEALTDHLADDQLLGGRIAARGEKVTIAPRPVTNVLFEPSLTALFQHELRWARTIRTIQPLGYAGTVVTFGMFWALLLLVSLGFAPAGWAALGLSWGLRTALAAAVHRKFSLPGFPPVWWIPARELLSFCVYFTSHVGRGVLWKQNRFRVSADGRLHERTGGEG